MRGPGFGLKSLGDKGWMFNQPGVGLWSVVFPLGFTFSVSLAALWWPMALCIQLLPMNLFLTHSGAKIASQENLTVT